MKKNDLQTGLSALFGAEPLAVPAMSGTQTVGEPETASVALKEGVFETKPSNIISKKPRKEGEVSRNKETKKSRKEDLSFEPVNLALRVEYRDTLKYLAYRKHEYLYQVIDEALTDYFNRDDIAKLLESI